METEESHIKSEVGTLLVNLVGVTWGHTSENREEVAITCQAEVTLEVWDTLNDLEDCLFVLFKELVLDFLV